MLSASYCLRHSLCAMIRSCLIELNSHCSDSQDMHVLVFCSIDFRMICHFKGSLVLSTPPPELSHANPGGSRRGAIQRGIEPETLTPLPVAGQIHKCT